MNCCFRSIIAAGCLSILLFATIGKAAELRTYVGVAWTEGIVGFGTERGMTDPIGPLLTDSLADGFDNASGTFSGSASASATFGTLGVAASADLANGNDARTAALGAASFTDTFTFTGGPVGTAGTVDFVFDITGSSTGSGDGEVVVALAVFQDTAFDLETMLGGLIFEDIQVNGDTFGVTVPVPVLFGTPTDLTFSLGVLSSVPPLLTLLPGSYAGTAEGTYDQTAELVEITSPDAPQLEIETGSGTNYLGNALNVATPEPSALILAVVGLLLLGFLARYRRRSKSPDGVLP